MSELVKFHLVVQELVELGEGEPNENTCSFFSPVNTFFQILLLVFFNTELLLCINTQIVILGSFAGQEGKDEELSWTWGRQTGLAGWGCT